VGKEVVQQMKYALIQFWYQYIAGWFEWQDAQCWAKEYHPAWVQFARKSKRKETRQYYREKILAAYRGEE
jgi:hypothetical protein